MPTVGRCIAPLVTAASIACLVGGCGGDPNSGADPAASVATERVEATTIVPATPATSAAPSDPPQTTSTSGTEPETSDRPLRYPGIATNDAEPGSNPLLSWAPVDGATLYRIAVLDPEGDPYWAWSGTETSVHLGGSATPTAVGARVFGEMTWQVSAHDAVGAPLAISERERLSP